MRIKSAEMYNTLKSTEHLYVGVKRPRPQNKFAKKLNYREEIAFKNALKERFNSLYKSGKSVEITVVDKNLKQIATYQLKKAQRLLYITDFHLVLLGENGYEKLLTKHLYQIANNSEQCACVEIRANVRKKTLYPVQDAVYVQITC